MTRELDEMQLDALQEIANMAGGNAATAISELVKQRVDITIPKVKVVNVGQLITDSKLSVERMEAVYAPGAGDLAVVLMLGFLRREVDRLHLRIKESGGLGDALDGTAQATLKILGEKTLASYLWGMSAFMDVECALGECNLISGEWGSILTDVLKSYQLGEEVCLMDIKFIIEQEQIEGLLIFAHDEQCLTKMLEVLEMV